VVPVLSRSAAHKAAPQVLVKAKKMPAIGTISRRVAGMPKLLGYVSGFQTNKASNKTHLVYAAFFSSTCLSF
jgi:hypothetical protein